MKNLDKDVHSRCRKKALCDVPNLEADPAFLDSLRQGERIAELERKLLLARNGLFWIQVRCACDEGDPCADKIASVARDHLEETKDPRLPE